MDIISYALAKKYVDESLVGVGALKGVPCKIQDISPITGGNRITFLWEDNDGNEHTSTLDVMNGVKGDKGDKGDRGEQGEQGEQGAQGIQGVQGIQGAKGDTGATGAQGIQGIQGIQGEKGDDGYPFLIYKQYDDISEFSESDFPEVGLMFMVMQEDFDPEDPSTSIGYPIYRYTGEGNPPYSLVVHLASQGIKGEKGDKGDTGAQGVQGEKGDKGDTGEQGAQGIQGIQGVQGEQGVGMPDGGTTGQVVVKASNNNYDYGFKDTADTVRPNSHALVESGAVYNAINQAVSSIYTPRGDLTCAELVAGLLIAENEGNVYQMSDSGTTSALFIQGAGKTINANDNVGIIKAGADTYLFNLMGNAFDLHDYQKKDLASAIEGASTVEGALSALSSAKIDKSDTYNLYYPSFELYDSWAEFLELLHQQGNGRYCGKAYLDSKWYSYIATITVQTSAWNGTALFMKEVDGEIIEAFKPSSSSNTWTVKQVFSSVNDDSAYVDLGNQFTAESWVRSFTLKAKRVGNAVSLFILVEGTLNDSSVATKDIFSDGILPQKYRPSIDTSCAVCGYQGSTGFMEGRITLGSDGKIALGEHYLVNATGGMFAFKWTLTYLV